MKRENMSKEIKRENAKKAERKFSKRVEKGKEFFRKTVVKKWRRGGNFYISKDDEVEKRGIFL